MSEVHMADPAVDWQPCAEDGCVGVCLPTGRSCWAHSTDADVDQALKRLGEGDRLDARGVPITPELLGSLLAAAPHDDGHPVLTDPQFDKATFHGHVRFGEAAFEGDAVFSRVTFHGDVQFGGATFEVAEFSGTDFEGQAGFDGTTFQRDARFGRAIFNSPARFDHATFRGDARFLNATFAGDTWFIGATLEGDAVFDEAAFQGDVGFQGAAFQGYAGFRRAAFQGYAGFRRAAFQGDARFDHAVFAGDTRFMEATFEGNAVFNGATFQDNARFGDAAFQGNALFEQAAFQGDARFGRAIFAGARFIGATVQRAAWFDGVTFEGDARFELAVFHRDARFDRSTFQRAPQLGPMLVRKALVLNGVAFHERIQVEVSAAACCCQRTRFLGGVQLRVRWAQVVLDDADLAAPSTLTGVPALPGLDEGRWARALGRLWARDVREGRPRVVSLRRADVAGLTVADVDLRACRFAGAHHLDQLRTEQSDFAYTPRGWRWTTRQTLAEEHLWRAYPDPDAPCTPKIHDTAKVWDYTPRGWAMVTAPPDAATTPNSHDTATRAARFGGARRTAGWYRLAHRPPPWLEVEQLTPAQIAALYRALRKGREDNKDEPGAADFYYGEMEMRRHAKREQAHQEFRRGHRGTAMTAAIEYAILWLYWLVSGYGLRAWRAVAATLVVLAVFAVLMVAVGFRHPAGGQATGAAAAVIYGVRTAIGLSRDPQPVLTRWGDMLQIMVRITVPVLLGLAVLSVRGRVKR
jgi:uncharacterized protein YjbI with pentapeptide repeats